LRLLAAENAAPEERQPRPTDAAASS
jgi:hypothetical protein